MSKKINNLDKFENMRVAGKIAAETLDMITEHVQPGITSLELNNICDKFIREKQANPSCLGYKGFPKSVCISHNHIICHGIPDERKLKDGDIINIDVTVDKDGWHGDTSRMYYVGNPNVKARRLVQTTYDCLMYGIEAVKPGNKLGDIGYAIQTHAEKNGFSVVRDYTGHGIGQEFHCDPQILHYGKPGTGLEIEPGMTFTIEPMINAGTYKTMLLQDMWTVITKDRSLSAQFEHTIGVTDSGYEIFTSSPNNLDKP